MIQEWSKTITRIKGVSGLSPVWFKHLDPVFFETNEEMKLTSSATETSFLNEQDGKYEEERNARRIYLVTPTWMKTTSWKVK